MEALGNRRDLDYGRIAMCRLATITRAARRAHKAGLAIVAACSLVACLTTISPYSEVAYQQATAVKAEAMTVISNATAPYSGHEAEVKTLELDVEKAYEYARGRPKNEISTKQWEIIRDPNGHSLVGLLERWKREGTLGQGFVTEEKGVISDQLDTVIDLESGKPKGSS
jgi:hypothetical protein